MYKEIWPFNVIDLDSKNVILPEFPTKTNKKSIIYFGDECSEYKAKTKIIIIPFCDCELSTPDIQDIEKKMLAFAKKNDISATLDNCIHIIKTIKHYVYHGFAII